MNVNRPGKLCPDGMFVFDEPVLVEIHGKKTFAEGYSTACKCGECVYVNPWPLSDNASSGFAIRSFALNEIGN